MEILQTMMELCVNCKALGSQWVFVLVQQTNVSFRVYRTLNTLWYHFNEKEQIYLL